MASVNIEEVVIGFLEANKQSGWNIYGDMPKGARPTAFVLVDRTGGPRENIVQDRAEILIEVYHKSSRVTASNEANRIADIIKNLESLEPVMRAKVNSLVKLDDLLGGYNRYQIYCDIYYRRELLGEGIIYPVIPSVGVLGIVAGPNITVNDDDPQYPIVSATGGGGSGGSNDFIYNSSGAQSGNRYNDWGDFMDAKAGIDTPIRLFLEQNETLPNGTYNMDNVIPMGSGRPYTNTGIILTIPSGVTISSWQNFKMDAGVSIMHQGSTPLVSANSGFVDIEMRYGNAIQTINAPAFSLTGSASANIRKGQVTTLVNGGVSPIYVNTTGTVIVVNNGSGSQLPNDAISGDISAGHGLVIADASAQVNPARADSGLTGSFAYTRSANALSIAYANSESGLTAENVQDAIDELAASPSGGMQIGDPVADALPNRGLFTDSFGNLVDDVMESVRLSFFEGAITGEAIKPSNFTDAKSMMLGGVDATGLGGTETYAFITDKTRDGAIAFVKIDLDNTDTVPPETLFFINYDAETEQAGLIFWPGGQFTDAEPLIQADATGIIINGTQKFSAIVTELLSASDEELPTAKAVADAIVAAVDAIVIPTVPLIGMIQEPINALDYPENTTGNSWKTPMATGLRFTDSADIRVTFKAEKPTDWDKSDSSWCELLSQSRDNEFGALDNFELAVMWANGAFAELEDKPYIYWEWTKAGGTSEAALVITDIDIYPGQWTTARITQDFDTGEIKIYRQIDYKTEDDDVTTADGKNWRLYSTTTNADATSIAYDSNSPGTWPDGEPISIGARMQGQISMVEAYNGLDNNKIIGFYADNEIPTTDQFTDDTGNEWTTDTGSLIAIIPGSDGLTSADIDTDVTLAGNSDIKIPSQKAVKTYVDTSVTGLLDFKGATDASSNPNYPAAAKGDAYVVSVAGKVGGASGKSVEVGDMYLATADNAGGTEASVGTSWAVLEHNLVGALLTSDLDTDYLFAADSNLKVPSQKAVKSRLAVIPPTSGDWYSMGGQSSAGSPGTVTAGKMLFHPIWLGAGTLDRIAVSTSAAAASTWRLGLYKANPSNGLPDGQAPFLDAGTVDMNAAPGVQAITISKAITEPGLYWAAILVDAYTASPTTHNVVYSSNPGQGILGLPQDMSSLGRFRVGRVHGSTVPTGSLPNAPSSSMSWAGTVPRVAVRYA